MSISETFSNSISLTVINKYDKGAVMQIWPVFDPVYHVACQNVVWIGTFLDIYLTTFSESVISEIQNLWGSSFFAKCWKFNIYFKNAAKNWEQVFCLWDNCIWIGIVKLSLLRTGYMSSAAKVLTRSPKN